MACTRYQAQYPRSKEFIGQWNPSWKWFPKFHEAHSPHYETQLNYIWTLRQDIWAAEWGKKKSHQIPSTSVKLHPIHLVTPRFLWALSSWTISRISGVVTCTRQPGVLLKRHLTCSHHGWLALAYGGIFSSCSPNTARCLFHVHNRTSPWRASRDPHWVSRTAWRRRDNQKILLQTNLIMLTLEQRIFMHLHVGMLLP